MSEVDFHVAKIRKKMITHLAFSTKHLSFSIKIHKNHYFFQLLPPILIKIVIFMRSPCHLVLSPVHYESEQSSWSLVTLLLCYLVTLLPCYFVTLLPCLGFSPSHFRDSTLVRCHFFSFLCTVVASSVTTLSVTSVTTLSVTSVFK